MSQSDKLGKYEVIRQIAVGGMAELYLARTVGMEGFEKLVCVKRILPQYINNPSFVNMFLNEARLAATLHHPNIAQVYEIGQEQGEFFFAMEYVHGEDLGRLVATAQETGVAISLDCALTLASGLCAGLHHAHEKASPEGKPLGVVHRDVSPTNVLVSYDGAVKLVDFGIARAGGTSPSTTGLKGKISYMSPEQCRGRATLDRRSDVFSIGTILYELTTGRRPFVDETEYGILQQIVTRDADPPSTVMPGYPPALEAIVMRALSRDVDRRFATALELQNQVEDFAHENRLRVSPLVLARLMSTLFPARLEEWDHARAQGAFFVEQHVVRTLIESGRTADSGVRAQPAPATDEEATTQAEAPTVPSPHGGEHEAPTVPAGAKTAEYEAPTVPAGRSSAPTITMQGAGAMPARASTPPPVGPISTPMPVATPVSQPRLPTPPPMPGVAPLPGVRYAQMPVPNNPGAVPIVTPMMAPPIASAGTLVSSALQAGTSAAASTMTPGSAMAPPPAIPYPPQGPPQGDFGAGDPYGQVGRSSGGHPAMPPQQQPQAQQAQGRGRSNARPTLVIRAKRRSWLPLVAVASAGLAGLVTLLVLNFGEDAPGARPESPAENTAKTAEPGAADPARSAESAAAKPSDPKAATGPGADPIAANAPPTGPGAANAAPGSAVANPAAADDAAGAGAANAPPGSAVANSAAAGNSASPGTGTATAPPAAGSETAAATTAAIKAPGAAPSALLPSASPPSDAKKRTVKATPETRKPARPRPRPDAKRGDARRKPEAKEPSWNDDSPFMPVQTQKR